MYDYMVNFNSFSISISFCEMGNTLRSIQFPIFRREGTGMSRTTPVKIRTSTFPKDIKKMNHAKCKGGDTLLPHSNRCLSLLIKNGKIEMRPYIINTLLLINYGCNSVCNI